MARALVRPPTLEILRLTASAAFSAMMRVSTPAEGQ
jgi:hypothetical protein